MTAHPNKNFAKSKPTQPYFYHLESSSLAELDGRADSFMVAFSAILSNSNYRFLIDLYARTSAKCGRCAVSCQVHQTTSDPRDVPCYRTNLLLDVYKQYFSNNGHWFSRLGSKESLTDQKIDEIAQKLQLNGTEFKANQKNPEIAAQIRRDYEEGIRLGIRGVPTVFINGKKMRDRSLKSLAAAIERELEKAKAAKTSED